MTLYTLVGDPHAKPDNLDKIDKLFDMIEDLGNETIILGDLLDTKEVIRGKCLNKYLERVKRSKLHFWFLVGNHDWFNLECEEHSLEFLRECERVSIVDKYLNFKNLHFIPYMNDPKMLKELLDQIVTGKSENKILFCHADIQNFDYGNGLVSDQGLEISDFKKFKRVISGHYHKYQQLGNITYLGTPFSHSFGESNQDKYIGIYDSDKDTIELLASPFPRHVTIELDCSKYSGHYYNDYDYFRVILKGTQEEIDQVQREPGIKYIEQPTGVLKKSVISEAMTTEQQFELWAKDIKGYTPDVVDLGLEILRNV